MLTIFASAMLIAADDGRCLERHFRSDGSVAERWIDDPGTIAITSTHGASSSASSSVSASSSSTHGGGTAVATADDGTRRTTMRRDNGRCTIVIDERPRSSGDRP